MRQVLSLPPITHLDLIFELHDNTPTKRNQNQKSRKQEQKPKPSPKWAESGRIGDAQLALIALTELPRLFGPGNETLINSIHDHAKCNQFLTQLGKKAGLRSWFAIPPIFPKDWADMMEAWIGTVTKERSLYSEDSIPEVRAFLRRQWAEHYKPLLFYSTFLTFICTPKAPDDGIVMQEISLPDDELLKKILLPKGKRDPVRVGFSAISKTQFDGNGRPFSAFGISERDAKSNLRTKLTIGTIHSLCGAFC